MSLQLEIEALDQLLNKILGYRAFFHFSLIEGIQILVGTSQRESVAVAFHEHACSRADHRRL